MDKSISKIAMQAALARGEHADAVDRPEARQLLVEKGRLATVLRERRAAEFTDAACTRGHQFVAVRAGGDRAAPVPGLDDEGRHGEMIELGAREGRARRMGNEHRAFMQVEIIAALSSEHTPQLSKHSSPARLTA